MTCTKCAKNAKFSVQIVFLSVQIVYFFLPIKARLSIPNWEYPSIPSDLRVPRQLGVLREFQVRCLALIATVPFILLTILLRGINESILGNTVYIQIDQF